MKKIYTIFLVIIIFMPFMVYATAINEIPPYVEVIGTDNNKYDINKVITNDKVMIEMRKKDTGEFYSWSFDKNEVGDNVVLDFNIDLKSSKESEIDSLTKNVDKTYISFSHHGDLPSKADIKIYVGNKYKNGKKLNLYYYNDTKNEIEFIKGDIEVKDGYIEFPIKHCSEYFLTGAIINNSEQVSKGLNYVIIGLFFLIMVLLTYTMFRKK